MALRFDTVRLDASKIRRDARGFARVDAIIAKPGVYTYTEPGGRPVREYLPPEEVARADSLASVQDAPVTNRHPRGMVTPETVSGVQIGHASGPATSTPEGAQATLVIARADAQGELGRGLIEVSRGVQVRIDETPGITPSGERYDRVQRDIVYNHIALGPSGWGRQGAGVSLRLDSNGDEHFTTPEKTMAIKNPKTGLEFKTDAEAQAYVDGLAARADAFPPKKKGEDEEEDEGMPKKGKKDSKDFLAEKARADAAQAKLDARDAADARAARTALETSARKILGAEAKFDGADSKPLSDRALRELVIVKLDAKADMSGRADSYVEAYYDVAVSNAKPAVSERGDGDVFAAALGGVRVDGTREEAKPTPRPDVKMRQDAGEAWKKSQGAAFSKK